VLFVVGEFGQLFQAVDEAAGRLALT
jgi:hypothetical protein